MSQFSYDFGDTEEFGDFVTLTPGRYVFELIEAKPDVSSSNNPVARVRLKVVAGNQAYIGGVITQVWNTTGKAAFRFRAFLKAIGVDLERDKGKINLGQHENKSKFGAIVKLQAGDRPNEAGETVYFHDLSMILPASQYSDLFEDEEDEEWEDDEVEDDEIEDDEVDDDEYEDDDEVGDDEVDEDDEADELTVADLAEMGLSELKELAEEYDISTKPAKGAKRLSASVMRKRIIEELFGEEATDDDDDDEEPF